MQTRIGWCEAVHGRVQGLWRDEASLLACGTPRTTPWQLLVVSERWFFFREVFDDEPPVFRFIVRNVCPHVTRGWRARTSHCLIVCADVCTPYGISQCGVVERQRENSPALGVQTIHSNTDQRAEEVLFVLVRGR